MIISVGYRVNYKKVTSFRQCAISILRNYMINGYAVNQIRDILPVLSIRKHINNTFKDQEV